MIGLTKIKNYNTDKRFLSLDNELRLYFLSLYLAATKQGFLILEKQRRPPREIERLQELKLLLVLNDIEVFIPDKLAANYPVVKLSTKSGKKVYDDLERAGINISDFTKVQLDDNLEVLLPWETPEFLKAWRDFKAYKARVHKFRYDSAHTEQSALKTLESTFKTQSDAIEAIYYSMGQGWKGIFPKPKNQIKNDKRERLANFLQGK